MNRPNRPNFNPYPPQNPYPYPVPPPRANALAAFKLALRFLTRIPVRLNPSDDTPLNRRLATVFYPLVGGVIGVILILTRLFFSHFGSFEKSGIFVTIAWVTSTGALHLDGLLDVFDGFFYAGPPSRRLEIMKDVHHGSYALIGAVLVLILKSQSIGIYFSPILFFAPVYARWAALKIVRDEPVVNPTGMAAQLKNELHPKAVSYGAILPGLAFVWSAAVSLRSNWIITAGGLGLPRWRMILIGAFEIIFTLLSAAILYKLPGWIGKIARRYIGGINGDVLGAAIEIAEVAVLVLFMIHPPNFIMTTPAPGIIQ